MARINADIGPSDNLVWIGLVMTLTMGVTFLLVGRLSDIFGRRFFFLVGNSFTVVGCILGAVAPNIDMIIGGNVFNGIGAAVQLSFGMIIEERMSIPVLSPDLAIQSLTKVGSRPREASTDLGILHLHVRPSLPSIWSCHCPRPWRQYGGKLEMVLLSGHHRCR